MPENKDLGTARLLLSSTVCRRLGRQSQEQEPEKEPIETLPQKKPIDGFQTINLT